MLLRSGKRKIHRTPRTKQKNKKNSSWQLNPSENLNFTDYLESSESIHSFSMEESTEYNDDAQSPNEFFDIASNIWATPRNNPHENDILRIIGALPPRPTTNPNAPRHSMPASQNFRPLATHTVTSVTASSQTANNFGTNILPTNSAPPTTNTTTTVVTTSSVSTSPMTSAIPNISSVPSITTTSRFSGLPPLTTNVYSSGVPTDVILNSLLARIDYGFENLNSRLNPNLPMRQPQINIPETQPPSNLAPQIVPPQVPTSSNPLQPSAPHADSISRLENIVVNLANQVKDLSDKFSRLSTNSQPSEVPFYPNNAGSNSVSPHSQVQVSAPPARPFTHSYKTWPDKWKVKYNGDNQKLAIEFFFDQLTSLRELNDVMWDHVISAFPLFLEGEALKWFFRYRKKEHVIEWHKLKRDMILQFRGTDSEDTILFKITNRKQGDRETFDQFYNSILDLKDRLTNEKLTDERLMGILYHNSKFEIRTAMVSVGPTNILDFVNKCRTIDKLYHPNLYKEFPNIPNKKISEIAPIPPLPVEDPDFNVEAFSNRRPNNPQQTANMKCWNCDGMGHSWQMCEATRKLFCYWCGFKNATCKNCPRCNQNFRPGKNHEPPPIASSPPPTPENL